jgi:hypothetical protein
MQMADFVYEPGRYEILGPRDHDLPTIAVVQEGYPSPSILGYKIRATYHPWLDKHPSVTAYLFEGTIIWLAPEYCTPVLLSTGEARLWICFGCPMEEQDWGWITCDPCAVVPGKSEQWIKPFPIDMSPVSLPAEAFVTEHSREAPGKSNRPTKGGTQEITDPVAPLAEHTSPTTTEARMPSSLFSKAISGVAASRGITQRGKGDKEASKYNVTDKSPARPDILDSPMTLPMISELQRINALNLEPSLPEIDDKPWPHDWQKTRQTTEAVDGDRKEEFKRSLEVINRSAVIPVGAGRKQRTRLSSTQKTQAKQTTGSSSEQHKWQ